MAVDVAVTKQRLRHGLAGGIALALGFSLPLTAAILPEERGDVLYHSYEGDEVRINGPSVALRENVGEHFSFSYKYYVDNITSASVDVRTYGSPYKETRVEHDFGMDILSDNTSISMGYSNSEENDYSANTGFLSISHTVFEQMTTVGLSFSVGDDEVRRNTDHELVDGYRVNPKQSLFKGSVSRYSYGIDVSQVMSKNSVLNLGFETITDTGYLNNPQRNVLVVDENDNTQLTRMLEEGHYPRVHTSNALALRAMYYLPYRAKISTEVRGFSDTWGVQGFMGQVGYTHPFSRQLVLDISYRFYSQNKATFYQDYFDEELVYMARDKELSTMTSETLAATVNYEFMKHPWWIFDKGSANVSLSKLVLNYEDYYDRSRDVGPDSVRYAVNCSVCYPFSINATVFQFYFSLWY